MSDKETKATTEKAEKKKATKKAATTKKESAKKAATTKKDTVKKSVPAKKEIAKKEDKLVKETKSKKEDAPKKKIAKEIKEDKKSKKEAEKKGAKVEDEESEVKAKGSKKTKAEINKEIKANISKDKANASRKDRTRAEKAAMREAKEDRKSAYTEEQKKAKLSNLVLAIMIFGVLFLMFIIPWGYNYFQKDASIEAYINNRGGAAAFQGIQIDKNKVAALSADGNKMYVTITDSTKDTDKETKYYKGKDGQSEMEFISAYFLAIIRPDVRGVTASAVCTANVGDKKAAEMTVKYSQIEDILAKRGITPDDLYKQQKQQEEEAKQEQSEQIQTDENGNVVTEAETEE